MPKDPADANFGWHYPPGVTESDIDDNFGDPPDAGDEADSDECYPYDCRPGRPCYNHYDG